MAAQLTDHYGAIDPAAFDADRPARPVMDDYTASARAEKRLWQTDAPRLTRGAYFGYAAHGDRRVVAIGAGSQGEVSTWTGRTASGALDGTTQVRA